METILLGTSLTCDFYDYENYVSYCEDNDIEPKGEYSNDYYDWISYGEEVDYLDFCDNIKYGKANDGYYTITFGLGLWDGKKSGYCTKVFSSLLEAIKEAIQSSDYSDYKITFKDGAIVFYGYHHDGTNTFTISRLSKNGERWLVGADADDFGKYIYRKTAHKKISIKDLF